MLIHNNSNKAYFRPKVSKSGEVQETNEAVRLICNRKAPKGDKNALHRKEKKKKIMKQISRL